MDCETMQLKGKQKTDKTVRNSQSLVSITIKYDLIMKVC